MSRVASAKNFLRPLTFKLGSRFFIACSSIEGRSTIGLPFLSTANGNSLSPDAVANTPEVPTSARIFPERFPFPKSISARSAAATFCLMYSSFVNLLLILSGLNFSSNADSRAYIVLPVVGS